jgi:lipid-binding SYLF domain-containing protein
VTSRSPWVLSGGGAQSALAADVVSFSRGHGVYVGVNLDGTIVSTSDDWNDLYYGRRVQAPDILMRTTVRSPHAKELLNVIATAAKNSAAKP